MACAGAAEPVPVLKSSEPSCRASEPIFDGLLGRAAGSLFLMLWQRRFLGASSWFATAVACSCVLDAAPLGSPAVAPWDDRGVWDDGPAGDCSGRCLAGPALLQSRRQYQEAGVELFTDAQGEPGEEDDRAQSSRAISNITENGTSEKSAKVTISRTKDERGASKTVITSVDTANATTVDEPRKNVEADFNRTEEKLDSSWPSGPSWTKKVIAENRSVTNTSVVARQNVSKRTRQPFVKVEKITNVTEETHTVEKKSVKSKVTQTVVTINIASASDILSVFLIMFTPIILAWAIYYYRGKKREHYAVLGPLTLCAVSIGSDLVNQSLAVVMSSPSAIAAIQAGTLAVSAGVWFLGVDLRKLPSLDLQPLLLWLVVALFFAVYQLLSHQVSYYCSLSEGIVFLNLCAPCVLLAELSTMPEGLQPRVSFNSKMALSLVVVGAILFSIQHPQFTPMGLLVAFALVVVSVPYRLLQRRLLGAVSSMPVSLMAFVDGLMLMVPCVAIAFTQYEDFEADLVAWLSEPSIVLMLCLSMATFVGGHVFSLLMLSANSATSFMVTNNMASFVTAFLGACFFGENLTANPFVFVGLVVSLVSSLWYSFEAQPAEVREAWSWGRSLVKNEPGGTCCS